MGIAWSTRVAGRRAGAGLLTILTVTGFMGFTGKAPAAPVEPRTYEVREIGVAWIFPQKEAGYYRKYEFVATRYEDSDNGDVFAFARAERLNCEGDEQSLSCGGGPEDFEVLEGEPTEFTFAEDLSGASAAFTARGSEQWGRWTPADLVTRPFEFIPGTYSSSESCSDSSGFEGSGEGRGFVRYGDAEGRMFRKRMPAANQDDFQYIARYTLTTECDPRDWWLLTTSSGPFQERVRLLEHPRAISRA
jgi:hypothetical protein